MTSNDKNNDALWRNIRNIKKKNKIYSDWVDLLACEIWKCKKDKDGNDEPILNENGKLPESRIDILEESLRSSDSDTSSVDSLDEDIEQLKEDIRRLDATEQHLDEVEEMGRDNQQRLNVIGEDIRRLFLRDDNQQRLNVIGGQIDDLEERANAMEADRDALEARIVAIAQRSGTGGTGGGKRRKRTRGKLRAKSRAKSRKKRRRKRRKSRRKSKGRKRRKSRRKRGGVVVKGRWVDIDLNDIKLRETYRVTTTSYRQIIPSPFIGTYKGVRQNSSMQNIFTFSTDTFSHTGLGERDIPIPEWTIQRVEQYNIAPNGVEVLEDNIKSFVGGRRKT